MTADRTKRAREAVAGLIHAVSTDTRIDWDEVYDWADEIRRIADEGDQR